MFTIGLFVTVKIETFYEILIALSVSLKLTSSEPYAVHMSTIINTQRRMEMYCFFKLPSIV